MAAPFPPAAAAPAALPAMVATQVARFKETIDGLPVDQLRTIDGRGCIQLIRTLRPALSELVGVGECCVIALHTLSSSRTSVGKVKSAIVCDRHADGSWRPRAGASLVAVKQVGGGGGLHPSTFLDVAPASFQIHKWCIALGQTIDRRPVREDPRVEISILQYLSGASRT